MMEQSLTDAINNSKEKLSGAKSSIAAYTEANGELTESEKTKAADTAYLESLTAECTETHASWGDRQKSAKDEMAALDKAKAILADRVKVFVQVSGKKAAKG